MTRITFEPSKFYVLDRFARTMQDAYVSGPFDTYLAAARDRAERNIADDCDIYAVPASDDVVRCYCDEPAQYVNEATDASPETPVCERHVSDGYRPL